MVGPKTGKGEMASEQPDTDAEQASELLLPEAGTGPLLQRDYWAVIQDCQLRPLELMDLVSRRFPEFAPEELCIFKRVDEARQGEPLELNDELTVRIRGAGTFGVRVIHKSAQSLTLGTLPGHPEAGRITFGAYPNARGDVIFHIRSRARSGSTFHYWGFVTAGEAMQTNTWTEFVLRAAVTAGKGVIGAIHADTTELEDEPEGGDVEHGPTFIASGDTAQ
jgi:hypothetical protein